MIVTKPRGCNLPHPKLELPEDFLSEEGSGWFRSWGGNYQSPQCWPGNDDGGGLVNCPTRWYLYCPLGICIDHLVGGGKHIWGVTNCFGHSRAEMGDFGPVFTKCIFYGYDRAPQKIGFYLSKMAILPNQLATLQELRFHRGTRPYFLHSQSDGTYIIFFMEME